MIRGVTAQAQMEQKLTAFAARQAEAISRQPFSGGLQEQQLMTQQVRAWVEADRAAFAHTRTNTRRGEEWTGSRPRRLVWEEPQPDGGRWNQSATKPRRGAPVRADPDFEAVVCQAKASCARAARAVEAKRRSRAKPG